MNPNNDWRQHFTPADDIQPKANNNGNWRQHFTSINADEQQHNRQPQTKVQQAINRSTNAEDRFRNAAQIGRGAINANPIVAATNVAEGAAKGAAKEALNESELNELRAFYPQYDWPMPINQEVAEKENQIEKYFPTADKLLSEVEALTGIPLDAKTENQKRIALASQMAFHPGSIPAKVGGTAAGMAIRESLIAIGVPEEIADAVALARAGASMSKKYGNKPIPGQLQLTGPIQKNPPKAPKTTTINITPKQSPAPFQPPSTGPIKNAPRTNIGFNPKPPKPPSPPAPPTYEQQMETYKRDVQKAQELREKTHQEALTKHEKEVGEINKTRQKEQEDILAKHEAEKEKLGNTAEEQRQTLTKELEPFKKEIDKLQKQAGLFTSEFEFGKEIKEGTEKGLGHVKAKPIPIPTRTPLKLSEKEATKINRSLGLSVPQTNAHNRIANEIGNIFSPTEERNATVGGRNIKRLLDKRDAEMHERSNEIYNVSRELNQADINTYPDAYRALRDHVAELTRIPRPSSVQKSVISHAKDIMNDLVKRDKKGKVTGYNELPKQVLIDQIQSINQTTRHDFAHGNPTAVFNPILATLYNAIESTGSPESIAANQLARQAHTQWAQIFRNDYIKPIVDTGNQDFTKIYNSSLKLDEFNQIRNALGDSDEARALEAALLRKIVDDTLSKYTNKKVPSRSDPALEQDLRELEAVATPEQIAKIRERLFAPSPLARKGIVGKKVVIESPEAYAKKMDTVSGIQNIKKELSKSPKNKKTLDDAIAFKTAYILGKGKLRPSEKAKDISDILKDIEKVALLTALNGAQYVNDLRYISEYAEMVQEALTNVPEEIKPPKPKKYEPLPKAPKKPPLVKPEKPKKPEKPVEEEVHKGLEVMGRILEQFAVPSVLKIPYAIYRPEIVKAAKGVIKFVKGKLDKNGKISETDKTTLSKAYEKQFEDIA